jgi:hypothetical protein
MNAESHSAAAKCNPDTKIVQLEVILSTASIDIPRCSLPIESGGIADEMIDVPKVTVRVPIKASEKKSVISQFPPPARFCGKLKLNV